MKETNKPCVSIVVPVYNVEMYLRRCVDSIINQTYINIEVILVNDGSTDSSGEICKSYSKLDRRVKVIHKENGGLSDARNVGINMATGEYILFVDSDDYIELNAIELMLSYMIKNNLDIICCNASKIINGKRNAVDVLEGGFSSEILSGEEYLIQSIQRNKYFAPVWLRMYRTNLITENRIFFKNGILHEDENWTPKILLAASRVGFYNFTFYNYIVRENSITQTSNRKKHIQDVINTCYELVELINGFNTTSKNKKIINDYFARLYMHSSTYGEYDNNFYKKLINKKFVLKNSYRFKTKLQSLIFILSVKLFRYLKQN